MGDGRPRCEPHRESRPAFDRRRTRAGNGQLAWGGNPSRREGEIWTVRAKDVSATMGDFPNWRGSTQSKRWQIEMLYRRCKGRDTPDAKPYRDAIFAISEANKFISRVIVFAILFAILFGIIILYGLLGIFCIFLLFSAIWKFLKKDNWKGIILALDCTNLQKKISRRKRKIFVFIFGYFYACDVIRFPDYQLISRQINHRFFVRS